MKVNWDDEIPNIINIWNKKKYDVPNHQAEKRTPTLLPSCSGCSSPVPQFSQQPVALISGLRAAGTDDVAVALHIGLDLFGPGIVQQLQGLLPGTSSSTRANAGEITSGEGSGNDNLEKS